MLIRSNRGRSTAKFVLHYNLEIPPKVFPKKQFHECACTTIQ